jgi:hypothetical protein
MRKPLPTEWLLAHVVGPDRAAAIYGDLLELAEIRGSLWFWTAYTRTLVRLCWRLSAAFLLGYVCYIVVSPTVRGVWTLFETYPSPWSSILQWVVKPLWFLAPYALVRYGRRDRLAQVVSLLFLLIAAGSYSYIYAVWVTMTAIAVSGLIAASFFAGWRRPAAATVALVILGMAAPGIRNLLLPPIFKPGMSIYPTLFRLDLPVLILLAAVCSGLHSRLLRPRLEEGVHV